MLATGLKHIPCKRAGSQQEQVKVVNLLRKSTPSPTWAALWIKSTARPERSLVAAL